jgi:hypothetical protein
MFRIARYVLMNLVDGAHRQRTPACGVLVIDRAQSPQGLFGAQPVVVPNELGRRDLAVASRARLRQHVLAIGVAQRGDDLGRRARRGFVVLDRGAVFDPDHDGA